MEIVRHPRENHLELALSGRLDGYWAQHLADTAHEVLRQGTHTLRLNLAETTYISSAGVGTLVQIHQQFASVGGTCLVIEPSRMVAKILDMVGLATLLTAEGATPTSAPKPSTPAFQSREIAGASFAIHTLQPDASLACRLFGDPTRLPATAYGPGDSHTLNLRDHVLSLGLGALGDSYESSSDRLGEFLAVAGAAAAQPTDGTNFPDYMLAAGSFVPQLTALYGLSCTGNFSHLIRFSGNEPIPLSRLLELCLEVSGAENAGLVIMAESAGLMGATLKLPPTAGAPLFAFPNVRQWLSFSAERCFTHSLALAAGVLTSRPSPGLAPFVRPLSRQSSLSGHFHAAAFAYRPLPKGDLDWDTAVHSLFAAGGLAGVLHLLADDREISGAGETELLRGACWVSPIANFQTPENPA